MKANEIKVGKTYQAKVNNRLVTVRVDAIKESYDGKARYHVTNLSTGRTTIFRSAAKFRRAMMEGEDRQNPTRPVKSVMVPVSQVKQKQTNSSAPTIAERCSNVDDSDTEGSKKAKIDPKTQYPENMKTLQEGKKSPDPTQQGMDVPSIVMTPTSSQDVAAVKSVEKPVKSGLATKLREKLNRSPQPSIRKDFSLVAGYKPTEEQVAILETALEKGLKSLVVAAGAGCCKTTSLRMLEEVLPGRGQYTAFNAALVAESKTKFKKASCKTTHSLAFGVVGRRYAHRLKRDRVRSEQIAYMLGINDFPVVVEGLDKPKILTKGLLAGKVMLAVRKFCQSADPFLTEKHFPYIDGIDIPQEGKRTYSNNEMVRAYLLPFAERAWEDLSDPQGNLPFSHDVYVKVWQLGTGSNKPYIGADYILLDEAQDTAPVMLDILQQQTHALVIVVGDDNQSIYQWRGAVNAMKAYPDAPRRLLSQSFRFGQAVADVANSILAQLDEPTDLVMKGLSSIPSRITEVSNPRCVLHRTNAGAVSTVLREVDAGGKPFLIGGSSEVVDFVKGAQRLQEGVPTSHPQLCCFSTWQEVQSYTQEDEGEDMKLLVKLIDEFGTKPILKALENMPREEDATMVVSTGHRCVSPDTLVETETGIVRIEWLRGLEGLIGTADGPKEFCNFVSYPKRRMLTIETKDGYQISVTEDHGLQAWTGSEYERVEAKDLVEGQFLRLALKPSIEPTESVALPDSRRIPLDSRARRYTLPTVLTDSSAFLFGAMVADGTIFERGLRYSKAYRSAAEEVSKAWNTIGVDTTAKELLGTNMWMVEIHSIHVANWLRLIGGMDPNYKYVPGCIWQADTSCHKAFLKGVFSDGTVKVKEGKLDVASLTTCFPDLAKDVHFMLRRLGIVSRRFKVNTKTPKGRPTVMWRVDIYGSFARMFLEEIGFPDKDRTEKGLAAEVPTKQHGYVVPVSWTEAGRATSTWAKQNARYRGYVSRNIIRDEFPDLQDRLEFHHDRIVSITPYEGPAMCVEVAEGNRFLQNGFDGWNSKGREWSSVKLGADFPPLSKMGDSDIRLLYVAATRAKEELDISACPAFLPSYNKDSGRERPGIQIKYTAPMPSVQQLEEYRVGKGVETIKEEVRTQPTRVEESSPTSADTPTQQSIPFTWVNFKGGGWKVRGPEGMENREVEVKTKSGDSRKVLLKEAVAKFSDAWVYAV